MLRERLQLDQAENIWDETMWIKGNFAHVKVTEQKTRYEHVIGLGILPTIHNTYVLNASVLRIF